jgi:hypothetical protein
MGIPFSFLNIHLKNTKKMTSTELVKLQKGNYSLVDGIYSYNLTVGLNKDRTKYYSIVEKGSMPYSAKIFITQNIKIDEDGNKYKCLHAVAGVGGLHIHSENIYSMLSELTIVQ